MLHQRDPASAYRRIAFEAQVIGSQGDALLRLCLDDIDAALSRALWADDNSRPELCHKALERAQMGVAVLLSGLDSAVPVSQALETFYRGMLHRLTRSRANFDGSAIAAMRDDLQDIRHALFG